jgi:hypothetical protein
VTVIALGILGFGLIVLLCGIILITVTFSRSLQKSLDHTDRVHERSQAQLHDVLDRLMAKTLEEYKVYDLGAEGGEIEIPEAQNDRPWDVPGVFLPGKGLAGGNKTLEVEEEEL